MLFMGGNQSHVWRVRHFYVLGHWWYLWHNRSEGARRRSLVVTKQSALRRREGETLPLGALDFPREGRILENSMTNEELLNQVEQIVANATAGLAAKGDIVRSEERLNDRIASLETRLDNRITNVEEHLNDRLANVETRLGNRIEALDVKLDAVQDAIGETLTHITEETDTTLRDHETRLRRLEHKIA
jgi:hypothetical protein